MQSKKVSVIVPIYNVEKYIGKCVDSIRNQDYPNIEIILVDDGSPDKSPQIIDEMASNDDRIKVIHEKNGGVSSARNRGIAAATGEYIMFVDGDDWVDDDYVSYFVDLIEKHGCDIGMDKNNYMVENTKSAFHFDRSLKKIRYSLQNHPHSSDRSPLRLHFSTVRRLQKD